MTSQMHPDDVLIGLLQASAAQAEPLDLDARALARTAVRRGRTRRALQAGGGVLAAAAVAGGAWLYGTQGTTPLPADPAPSTSPTPDGMPTTGPFADDLTMERLPVLDDVRPGVVPEGWVSHEVSGLRLAVPDGWSEASRLEIRAEPAQAARYGDLWRREETLRLTGPDGAAVIAAESAVVEGFSPDNPPQGYVFGYEDNEETRSLLPVAGSDLAVASLHDTHYEGSSLDVAEVLLRASDGRGYVVVATGLDALDDPDTLVKLLGTFTFADEAHRTTPLTDVPLWQEADQEIPGGWQSVRQGSVTVSLPTDWQATWSVSDGEPFISSLENLAIGDISPRTAMTTDQAQHRLETPGAEAVLVRSVPSILATSDEPWLDGQVDVRLPSGKIVTIAVDLLEDEGGAALLRQIAGTVRVDP